MHGVSGLVAGVNLRERGLKNFSLNGLLVSSPLHKYRTSTPVSRTGVCKTHGAYTHCDV